jgi:hypothetical protein
VPLICRISF